MSYLLETNLLLWVLSNDFKLPEAVRLILDDDRNDIYYSVISIWEVALKHLSHPEQLKLTAEQASAYCRMSGFQRLSVEEKHIFLLESLKRPEDAPSHKDPFDKMLISQAKGEEMLFLTHDALLSYYNEPCIVFV